MSAFPTFGSFGGQGSSGKSGGGGGGVADFFKNIMGNKGGVGDLSEYAQSQGYSPGFNQHFGQGFKSGKSFVSLSQMQKRQAGDPQFNRGGLAGQLTGALLFDTIRQQKAADQFAAEQRAMIGGFGEALGRNVSDIKALGDESWANFQGLGAGLEGRGEAGIARFEGGVTESRGFLQAQIRKAEKVAEGAVLGLKDRTNIDASSAAFGINARVRAQTDRINSDPTMTGAQKRDALFAANQEGIRQQGAQINQIMGTFNQQQAGLRMAQAQISSAGAGQLGQFESTVTGARVQSQAQANAMFQAGAAYRAQGESVRTAALNVAAQFELSGRQAMFDMITNAPRGIISVFAGLTSLLGALTLPGISGLGPLQLAQGSLGLAGANT